jgi:hypothetical protein
MTENEIYGLRRKAEHSLRSWHLDPGNGRGIVTTAYDREFASSWVQLCELKRLGVTLPIEVFHCPGELSGEQISLLEGIGLNLTVRLLNEGEDGFASKVYSVIRSSFQEVLWIDSDNVPIHDPAFLFEDAEYLEKGSLFWRDVSGVDRSVMWHPDASTWRVFGIPFNDGEEFESGQFLIDKARCAKELGLVHHYTEERDTYYRWVHGDKDTFRMAWLVAHEMRGIFVGGGNFLARPTPYGFMPFGPFHIGAPNPWKKWGGGSVMQQRDRVGKPLFNHRSIDKFSLELRNGSLRETEESWRVYGPDEEHFYLAHLSKLRSLLQASAQQTLSARSSARPSSGSLQIVWLPEVL